MKKKNSRMNQICYIAVILFLFAFTLVGVESQEGLETFDISEGQLMIEMENAAPSQPVPAGEYNFDLETQLLTPTAGGPSIPVANITGWNDYYDANTAGEGSSPQPGDLVTEGTTIWYLSQFNHDNDDGTTAALFGHFYWDSSNGQLIPITYNEDDDVYQWAGGGGHDFSTNPAELWLDSVFYNGGTIQLETELQLDIEEATLSAEAPIWNFWDFNHDGDDGTTAALYGFFYWDSSNNQLIPITYNEDDDVFHTMSVVDKHARIVDYDHLPDDESIHVSLVQGFVPRAVVDADGPIYEFDYDSDGNGADDGDWIRGLYIWDADAGEYGRLIEVVEDRDGDNNPLGTYRTFPDSYWDSSDPTFLVSDSITSGSIVSIVYDPSASRAVVDADGPIYEFDYDSDGNGIDDGDWIRGLYVWDADAGEYGRLIEVVEDRDGDNNPLGTYRTFPDSYWGYYTNPMSQVSDSATEGSIISIVYDPSGITFLWDGSEITSESPVVAGDQITIEFEDPLTSDQGLLVIAHFLGQGHDSYGYVEEGDGVKTEFQWGLMTDKSGPAKILALKVDLSSYPRGDNNEFSTQAFMDVYLQNNRQAHDAVLAQAISAEMDVAKAPLQAVINLKPGVNLISIPLKPEVPFTAQTLIDHLESELAVDVSWIIRYNTESWWAPEFETHLNNESGASGFDIQGGQSYLINTLAGGQVAFTGKAWTGLLNPVQSLPGLANYAGLEVFKFENFVNPTGSPSAAINGLYIFDPNHLELTPVNGEYELSGQKPIQVSPVDLADLASVGTPGVELDGVLPPGASWSLNLPGDGPIYQFSSFMVDPEIQIQINGLYVFSDMNGGQLIAVEGDQDSGYVFADSNQDGLADVVNFTDNPEFLIDNGEVAISVLGDTNGTGLAPSSVVSTNTWAFVVSGTLTRQMVDLNETYTLKAINQTTGKQLAESQNRGYDFQLPMVDFSRRDIVSEGDLVKVEVIGSNGKRVADGQFAINREEVATAYRQIQLQYNPVPDLTRLLQNYPNPFNPETWIPFELNQDSEVSITIYDVAGYQVRQILVGFQSAGIYSSRDKAAYWDGKTETGETVASGVYFYNITAGDYTQTRRMVILK